MSNKSELLHEANEAYNELRTTIDPIDEAHGAWQGAVGEWSVVNVLQHLSGWLGEMATAAQRMARGERPTPEGVSYDDVDGWNARFVGERGEQSLDQAREELAGAHTRFLQAVEELPEERFAEGKTASRLVYNTAVEHYREHAEQIREYLAGEHA